MSVRYWNKEWLLDTVFTQMRAMVRLCDLETNRILLINDFARREFGLAEGQLCCADPHSERCGCLSNEVLRNNPEQTLHFQWYDPRGDRWLERHVQAVTLGDALVRLEMTFDLTDKHSRGSMPD